MPRSAAGARGTGARYWPCTLALSSDWLDSADLITMAPTDPVPTREERLAAKLRENLKRRKDQARAAGAVPTLPKREPDR